MLHKKPFFQDFTNFAYVTLLWSAMLLMLNFVSNFCFVLFSNFCHFEFLTACIYSQTCSNDHLYKTTTRLRRPMLSPPKQIPIQLLLYKTTTCLTRPATIFFCLPNDKKPVYNNHHKTLPTKEMRNKH